MLQEQSQLEQQEKDFEKNAMISLKEKEYSLSKQCKHIDFGQATSEEVRDIALSRYDLLNEHTAKTERQSCLSDISQYRIWNNQSISIGTNCHGACRVE